MLNTLQGAPATQSIHDRNCVPRGITWYYASYLLRERRDFLLGSQRVELWLRRVTREFQRWKGSVHGEGQSTAEALTAFHSSVESLLLMLGETSDGGSIWRFCERDLLALAAPGQRCLLPLLVVVELCPKCANADLALDLGKSFRSFNDFPYMKLNGAEKRCARHRCAAPGPKDSFCSQDGVPPQLHVIIIDHLKALHTTTLREQSLSRNGSMHSSDRFLEAEPPLAVWDPLFPEARNVAVTADELFFSNGSAARHCVRLWIEHPGRLARILEEE